MKTTEDKEESRLSSLLVDSSRNSTAVVDDGVFFGLAVIEDVELVIVTTDVLV